MILRLNVKCGIIDRAKLKVQSPKSKVKIAVIARG